MNIEIKKGDHVFIPGVVQREPDEDFVYVEYKCGSHRSGLEYFRRADVSELLILHPANGIENTEPAPKYDPCRLFRKGDIVEPCQVNGRWLSPAWEHRTGIRYEVTKDEDPLTAHMEVKDPDSPQPFLVHAAFFKLVTPVEEMVPYRIADHIHGWIVYKDTPGNVVANFNKNHPHAKEAAEAERDRLNAEYWKEQK